MKLPRILTLFWVVLNLAACSTTGTPPATPTTVDLSQNEPKSYGPSPMEGSSEHTANGTPTEKSDALPIPRRLPKIGLVLGPGGTRGFAHLGIIKELEEEGFKISAITGSGFGALIGGTYAFTGNVNRLEWEIFKLREEIYYDPPLLGLQPKVARGKSMFQFLNQLFHSTSIQDFKIPFAVSALPKRGGNQLKFRRGHAATLIRASLAIPGLMEGIHFSDDEWTSAATVEPLPIDQVRKLGADIVIAVDLLSDVARVSNRINTSNDTFKALLVAMSALSQENGKGADILIQPDLAGFEMIDFNRRGDAIFRGKKAVQLSIRKIKEVISNWKPPKEEWIGPLPENPL